MVPAAGRQRSRHSPRARRPADRTGAGATRGRGERGGRELQISNLKLQIAGQTRASPATYASCVRPGDLKFEIRNLKFGIAVRVVPRLRRVQPCARACQAADGPLASADGDSCACRGTISSRACHIARLQTPQPWHRLNAPASPGRRNHRENLGTLPGFLPRRWGCPACSRPRHQAVGKPG